MRIICHRWLQKLVLRKFKRVNNVLMYWNWPQWPHMYMNSIVTINHAGGVVVPTFAAWPSVILLFCVSLSRHPMNNNKSNNHYNYHIKKVRGWV